MLKKDQPQPDPRKHPTAESYEKALKEWQGDLPSVSVERRKRELKAEDLWIYVYDRLEAREVKRLYDLRPHRSNYPLEVQRVAKEAAPEVESLWKYVWQAYKRSEKNLDERSPLEIAESFSLKWIRKNKPRMIKESFFKGKGKKRIFRNDYPEEREMKTLFIGRLYQIIISHHFPDQRKTKHYGYHPLNKLHRNLV
jgi:hypothetical protein